MNPEHGKGGTGRIRQGSKTASRMKAPGNDMAAIDRKGCDPGELVFKGSFGLEKESLRVTEDGFLSHTPHPFPDEKNIDRDFCENQIELITDVCDSADGVYRAISDLHNRTVATLFNLESGREFLWNFSNPPYVRGEDDILVAQFSGNLYSRKVYRDYLAKKYGKKKMLFSGIHFNFSFSDELIRALFKNSGGCEQAWQERDGQERCGREGVLQDEENLRKFKDGLYLALFKDVVRYGWLIVYLMASSPLMDGSYFDEKRLGEDVISPYASARCSRIGYWNEFTPILDCGSLCGYVKSIEDCIESGRIIAASELYYPVRLKPRGENSLDNLKSTGVDHIELRMLDLNPLAPAGIFKSDICFLHLLLIYLTANPGGDFDETEQENAINNIKNAAVFRDDGIVLDFAGRHPDIREETLKVLDDMERFFYGKKNPYPQAISYQREKLDRPGGRYAERIMKTYRHDYVKQGLAMAARNAAQICRENPVKANV